MFAVDPTHILFLSGYSHLCKKPTLVSATYLGLKLKRKWRLVPLARQSHHKLVRLLLQQGSSLTDRLSGRNCLPILPIYFASVRSNDLLCIDRDTTNKAFFTLDVLCTLVRNILLNCISKVFKNLFR
jgi:hypothetical protein